MRLEEHIAKPLLAGAGIAVPQGRLATSPDEARQAAAALAPVMVKAQAPTGGRGKAGGVLAAESPEAAADAARRILGMTLDDHVVSELLVERRAEVAREYYAAVLNDAAARAPLVLFSTRGGIDIERAAAAKPEAMRRRVVDITAGFGAADAADMLAGLDLGAAHDGITQALARLYRLYRDRDAELVEVNPLAVTAEGDVLALDCKLVLDDSAAFRQADLAARAAAEPASTLERRGRALGLRYIELDGSVGVLANGAGLTMATMDAIRHFGGRPANFLEIGGDAYGKARPALELVLANPRARSLLINFCGAFARTDEMAAGVAAAWEALAPQIPVFFSIHGTGEEEAIRLIERRLGIVPHDLMDDAVKAAVAAAR